MKKLLLVTITCLTVAMASAQTNVSGFINANTTWTLAGSPYIVVGNALLSHGYTLYIEPGVVVKFDTNRTLQIDGELIAIGSPHGRITFTSNKPSPAPGDWGKIHFADTSVDAVFDTAGNYISGSIMKNCDVMYGGSLGFGEVHVASSVPYFSNCNFLSSSFSGLYSVAGGLFVDSSSAKNCSYFGIYYLAQVEPPGKVVIHADTLEANVQAGINLTNYNSYPPQTIEISDCYFLSNTTCAIMCPQAQKIKIFNNYFYGNNASNGLGIISTYNNSLWDYQIECNRFINNQTGNGAIDIPRYSGGQSYIRNNYFENNTSSVSSCINIVETNNSNLYVTNNYFLNNSTTNGPCCNFTPYIYTSTPGLQIQHNNFINNSATGIIRFNSTQINNSSYNVIDLKYNNFIGSSTQIQLYNAIPYGSPNIYADSNYWNSGNTQHVDSVIYDYFDFGNQSVVYYSPILTSPALVDTTCPPPPITTSIQSPIPNPNSQSYLLPNPFTNHSTLRLSQLLTSATLHIYNMYGQLVQSQNEVSGKEILIDRKNLDSGIYIYVVTEKQRQVCTGKAVIY